MLQGRNELLMAAFRRSWSWQYLVTVLRGRSRRSVRRLRYLTSFSLPSRLTDGCRRQGRFHLIYPVLSIGCGTFEECIIVFGVKQISELWKKGRGV
jgi:hypothetical protein